MCFNSLSSTPGKFKTLALVSVNFLYVPTFHPVPHLAGLSLRFQVAR